MFGVCEHLSCVCYVCVTRDHDTRVLKLRKEKGHLTLSATALGGWTLETASVRKQSRVASGQTECVYVCFDFVRLIQI